MFISVGTGGHITGVSRRLKELNPGIKIVGVDPMGSVLADPEKLDKPDSKGPWVLEGAGKDYLPRVFDRT